MFVFLYLSWDRKEYCLHQQTLERERKKTLLSGINLETNQKTEEPLNIFIQCTYIPITCKNHIMLEMHRQI